MMLGGLRSTIACQISPSMTVEQDNCLESQSLHVSKLVSLQPNLLELHSQVSRVQKLCVSQPEPVDMEA